MDATNDTSPSANEPVPGTANEPVIGTKDGSTAADNDQPYKFGHRPNASAPYPFSERQYARLLILRSRVHANGTLDGRMAA